MSQKQSNRMDLVEGWRRRVVLKHIRGRLLDLGCGYNNLVAGYSAFGVGVDVFPWAGVDVLVGDAAKLPFPDASFDTVTILAALNHIPNRDQALKEIYRLLRPDGQLILTMISPLVGQFAHVVFRHDEDVRGGMEEGELKGLTNQQVRALLTDAGLPIRREQPFQFGLNRVFIAQK